MNRRDEFYAERDARTVAYGVVADLLNSPVGIVVGPDAAESAVGQATSLAVVNLLARIHRRLTLWLPASVTLVAPTIVAAAEFGEACQATAQAIDPYIEISCRELEDIKLTGPDVPSIGIGRTAPTGCAVYAGTEGFVGVVDAQPLGLTASGFSVLGGGLSACLAAGELLRSLYGHAARSRRASLWNFDEGVDADVGPALDPHPLDIGNMAIVGAGAVASGFAYWVSQLGHAGDWVVIDRDRAELHNTNRCLGLVAADAGWALGEPGGEPMAKAEAAAALMNAGHFESWYHEWLTEGAAQQLDLVLPLANEFDVRHAIGQRGDTILLHATTSANWTAELHRHLAGTDGCINCRLPQPAEGGLRCATGALPEIAAGGPTAAGVRPDAALPFLSAAAGLLLLASLVQLEQGVIAQRTPNHWRLLFGPGPRVFSRSKHLCVEGCGLVLPPSVRQVVNAGRRWAGLDGGLVS